MRRAVATIAPPATIHTPTTSTLVPIISMIRRKDSMAALIAGKRADFQCCYTPLRRDNRLSQVGRAVLFSRAIHERRAPIRLRSGQAVTRPTCSGPGNSHPHSCEFVNRADGSVEIEGKAATARGERLGRGAWFKFVSQVE